MKIVTIEENKNNLIVKHQELVRTARYKLGDTAIKTLSLLISMIKVSDTEFHQYVIKLSEFKELTGAGGKEVFKYVDKMTNELMSNPFYIHDNIKLNWVAMAQYQEGEGVVIFEIHRFLKPYLLELQKNFLKYNIANILLLKSGYVIRLYELCKDHLAEATRYKESNTSITFDIKIDRLRELFEIPESYLYKDIRVNIIDKAVAQFKEKTDIQIEYKEQKIGRKVDRLLVTVKANNKGSNNFLLSEKNFISYMRKNFVNADILQALDRNNTEKMMIVSVAPDGKLYDKHGQNFDAKRTKEMWSKLYEMALDKKLLCLQQGTLF